MIFLDSSFLVSVSVPIDQNHEPAVKLDKEIAAGKFGNAIISDYIFDETVTAIFSRTKNLHNAVLTGSNLLSSVRIVKIDEKIFQVSWELFKNQKSTKFSFTDCTNLALMEDNGIKNIATFDEDFKNVKEINVVS